MTTDGKRAWMGLGNGQYQNAMDGKGVDMAPALVRDQTIGLQLHRVLLLLTPLGVEIYAWGRISVLLVVSLPFWFCIPPCLRYGLHQPSPHLFFSPIPSPYHARAPQVGLLAAIFQSEVARQSPLL